MAAERGRQRSGRASGKRRPAPTVNGVRLAAGVRLVATGSKHKVSVLICADGKVQLNEGAVAILRLCDGSRTREQIVREAARRAPHGTLAADIEAFLNAARARGWIV
ncbi:MAG: pyrroloquinoline quinone biosynthesis peptide chaperone PqqD [Gammaproteobacteria bacterium]|nr:pyrroloquinoline quinone biosynthesis peptide chaperone PqqD [Gammaproteobacteria bacterium]